MYFVGWILGCLFRGIAALIRAAMRLAMVLAIWFLAQVIAAARWARGHRPVSAPERIGHAGLVAFVETHVQVGLQDVQVDRRGQVR